MKDYDANLYDLLSVTTDILVFSVSDIEVDSYRKLPEKAFSVLLVKRKNYPFKGNWCLPGGFLKIDEELEESPLRILKKETNLDDIYLEQLYTFGGVDRDPRLRVINVAYMALIDKERLNKPLMTDSAWFTVVQNIQDNVIDLTLYNGGNRLECQALMLKSKIRSINDLKLLRNEGLAFDNALVLIMGMLRLKNKIDYTDIIFNMMPNTFTLKELQKVYEVILNKKLHDQAFRRQIANKVVKTDMVKVSGGHRPSTLYRYRYPKDN